MFKAELIVRPRPGVRDPQADAVQEALRTAAAQAPAVECVGRYLSLRVQAHDEAEARHKIDELCRRLLVNPNLETYEVTLEPLA